MYGAVDTSRQCLKHTLGTHSLVPLPKRPLCPRGYTVKRLHSKRLHSKRLHSPKRSQRHRAEGEGASSPPRPGPVSVMSLSLAYVCTELWHEEEGQRKKEKKRKAGETDMRVSRQGGRGGKRLVSSPFTMTRATSTDDQQRMAKGFPNWVPAGPFPSERKADWQMERCLWC